MITNIVITLDRRRMRTDGTYPLIMRLGHRRKTLPIPLNIYLPVKDWNEEKRLIKNSFVSYPETANRINNRIAVMPDPREAKYEDSYEQPFFEMMARFQKSLRINNDTLLITIGYSFNDKHINAAIEEALNQNPSFRLAVIDPMFDNDNNSLALKEIKTAALESERVIMISERFAEFANHFPEIKTYDTENFVTINLKNDSSKD